MNKYGYCKLGLAFAGCFLGAGYVSGQELLQFFGSFGVKGILGLCLSMVLLLFVGIMMLRLNQITGIAEADKLVVPWNVPVLRAAVVALESLFLFGIVVIMTAGVGALANQLFGLPQWLGSLIFVIIVAAVSLAGLSGMVSAFSLTVPVLVAITLCFGIVAVARKGVCIPQSVSSGSSSLMGFWGIAAITFACYNIFGGIAVISPLGEHMKGKGHIYGGVALGALLLFIVAASVLISLGAFPDAMEAELPMLALASELNVYLGYVYALLLLFAMFGTALSSLVAFTNLLHLKSEKLKKRPVGFLTVSSVLIFCGSLFGFGELIGIIYPIFGYLSSVFIVLLTVHYFKARKKVKA